jgi:two-component system phosphate regulon sensor histidine kinase PhoR
MKTIADLILENINQGIVAIDSKARITLCNKKAEEVFDFTFNKPIPIKKLIRNKTLIDNVQTAIAKSEYVAFDYNKSGTEDFDIRLLPVVSDEIRLIMTIQNVTHVRKVILEKQQFFSNASHELNTPLSSIIGYSELMLSDKTYNDTFVETIHKEATRMKELIGDMLKISELEENKKVIDEKINLRNIVEQVITAATPKASSKGIKVAVVTDDCCIFANHEKITEVVANLVDNAIKYTGKKGYILVSLAKNKNEAILSVKDTGIGIPSHAFGRVFERFYRVDKGRAKTEGGTGLGLAIVKHICNHYKAPIRLQSKEGVGTEVTITFASTN